jgi:hypothetical protein
MAKAKATKGDSKGEPLVTQDDSKVFNKNLSEVKLPKLEPQVAEAVALEVIKGLYVAHLNFYFKGRDVKTAENGKVFTKEELEKHESMLEHLETTICYIDGNDNWLKDLHDGKLEEKPKK